MGAFYQDREFDAGDIGVEVLAGTEFESCTFRGCAWADADLRKARFTECLFQGCDLSNAKVDGTSFRTVRFTDCKLLGVQFEACNSFLLVLAFERCRLDYASFRNLVLKGAAFISCQMHESDFSGADLSEATFSGADMAGAVFDGTRLEGADLRDVRNLVLDPQRNRLRGARFSLDGLPGLLERHGIMVEG